MAVLTKPKFGFTYPTVTGENQITAFRRIRAQFPNMQLWSHYYNGTDLPAWNEPWFVEADDDVIFLISIKHTNVNDIGNRIAQMPTTLRGRVFIFLHHEPDQWRSASDNRGDPDPTTWKNRQITFANLRATATWRNWIQHWVCFTEDRWRTDRTFCENNWGNVIQVCPSIDGVAFDCFNIGRSITRVGSDIFGVPLEKARDWQRPLIIREYGQVVPTDTPDDNQAVADRIRENWAYAKSQHQIDKIFFGIVWYYNHNNTLEDPSGTRPGRPITEAAITEIMADAALAEEPPIEPDPDDPQYQIGFAAGQLSMTDEIAALQAEVDTLAGTNEDLVAQVAALQSQLTDAQNQAATAKSQGRLEAFDEVVNWAQMQV